ncbi:hypothetical protein FRC11_013901, partial [Ceratobasidium sp. 423]
MAPRTHASRSSSATRGGRVRAQSLPNTGEHTPSSSGRYVLARPPYPTPESANHKSVPRIRPPKSHLNRGLSLDFEAPSMTQSGAQAVINLDSSDSDDAVIAEYDSPKRKKSLPILQPNSEEEDEGSDEDDLKAGREKERGKVPLEY